MTEATAYDWSMVSGASVPRGQGCRESADWLHCASRQTSEWLEYREGLVRPLEGGGLLYTASERLLVIISLWITWQLLSTRDSSCAHQTTLSIHLVAQRTLAPALHAIRPRRRRAAFAIRSGSGAAAAGAPARCRMTTR